MSDAASRRTIHFSTAHYPLPRGYKRTEVGVIPEEWEVKLLDSVSDVRDGTHESPKFYESGVPFVTSKNIVDGRLYLGDVPFISEADAKIFNVRSKVDKGNILMSMIGTVGNAVLVDFEPGFCIKNVALIKPKEVAGEYLIQFILSTRFQNYLLGKLTGGIQKFIALGKIRKIPIPLPPHPEQRAIAAALSDVDAWIAALDKLIAKKRAVKQAAMQDLLTGRVRLPGYSGEWIVRKLGEIADIRTGDRNNEDKIDNGQYPFFVRSQTVERINTYSYDGEAILVPGEGGIGSIFHYINGRFDYHQRVYKISAFANGLDGKFIYYYMMQHFHKQAMQHSVKATVDSLRLPTFTEFQIRAPSFEEQTAIAAVLSDMDAEIEALERQRAKAVSIKQGMMQELLTGRIRLV